MINFGNMIQLQLPWTDFKTIVVSKNLFMQYDFSDPSFYIIFAIDNSIVYYCTIYITDPLGIPKYDSAANFSNKSDFETNFKQSANKSLSSIVSIQSTLNSTITPLTANSIFTGIGEDISNFISTDISIFSSHISAVNGFVIQWSQDNIIFDYSEYFTILSNVGQYYSFAPRAKYFRLIYTNGLVDQANFSISVTHYRINRSTYVQNLSTDIPNQKATDVVRSVLAAQKLGGIGDYTNLQATSSGLLKVSLDTSIYPALTPIAVVQKHNTSPLFSTSISTTFTSNVHLNNTIIVAVIQGQGTFNQTYTLSDSFSNIYNKAAGTKNITPSGSSIDVWYAISKGTGSCTVLANNFPINTNLAIQVYEVSGILVGSSVDKIAASASLGTSLSVGPVSTVFNGEFCVAAYGTDITSIISPGTGWVSDLSAAGFGCFSQIQSTAGSITGTATTIYSVNSINILATFLPAINVKPIQTDQNGRIITKAQLQSDDGYAIVLGQNIMSSSLPVTIASNQSEIQVKQGAATALNGKWPVQLTDGTNVMPTGDVVGRAIFEKITDGTNIAAVKAASTASAATDPSLVTAFSPNSPLPTGSNVIGAVTQSAGPWTENLTQVASNAVATAATGIQKVGIVGGTGISLETTAGALDYNLKNIGNSTVTTLSAGEQKVAVEGLATAGAAVSGNPVQVGGKDPSGNAQPIALAAEQSQYVTNDQNRQVIQSNATVIASGNTILTGYGNKEVSLFINVKNAPTGTSPTLTYTIQEVDPGDQTTVLGTSTTGAAITAAGTQILTLELTKSGVIKVSWVIGGSASPTFTGVYATLVTKLPGVMIGVDSTGTQHSLLTDTSGNLNVVTTAVPASGTQDIAFGKILMSGAASNIKFACRRTTYTEQTTGAQRSMSSSSASDTSAGTGARQVKITYFTSDLVTKKTETITMNGTAAVNTINTDICFIEKMEVISVGSTGANVGTITLFTTTGGGGGGGSVIGTIAFSTSGTVNANGIDNRTYWSHHYVMVGKTCTINTFDAGTQGNQNSEAFLSSVNPLVSTNPDVQISDSITVGLNSGTTPRVVPNTIKIIGPARITLYFIPAGNNTAFYGTFDYYET